MHYVVPLANGPRGHPGSDPELSRARQQAGIRNRAVTDLVRGAGPRPALDDCHGLLGYVILIVEPKLRFKEDEEFVVSNGTGGGS